MIIFIYIKKKKLSKKRHIFMQCTKIKQNKKINKKKEWLSFFL